MARPRDRGCFGLFCLIQSSPHGLHGQTDQLIPWRGSKAWNVIPRAQSLPKHPANIFRQSDIWSLAGLTSGDLCALTLVLALTVAVVLAARGRQESVNLALSG